MTNHMVKQSRLLSYILRHKPEEYSITLDREGWCTVGELVRATGLTQSQITAIAEADEKGRYQLKAHGQMIRATQGHTTTQVDISFDSPAEIPAVLLHGTAYSRIDSIKVEGLVNKGRHHVHLTECYSTAIDVGSRYGKPVVLAIDAAGMIEAGHHFYRAYNGVWLCPYIPPQFITIKNPA